MPVSAYVSSSCTLILSRPPDQYFSTGLLVLRGAAADWSFRKGVDKELFEDLPDMHLPFVDDKLSCINMLDVS